VTIPETLEPAEPAVVAGSELRLVPPAHGVASDEAVALAVRLVDHMDVLDLVAAWKAAETKGPGGRPSTFGYRALLVSLVLCAITDQPLHLTRVRDVMFRQLSPTWRTKLGIPDPPAEHDTRAWDDPYRNVRTRFHDLVDLVDPSDTPKNRRLDPDTYAAQVQARRAERSDAERSERYDRLEWLVNQIIEASWLILTDDELAKFTGSAGVDATPVRSHSRAQKQSRRARPHGKRAEVLTHPADPDAAFYVREGDHRDDGSGAKGRDKVAWAYEATLVIAGDEVTDGVQVFPSLALGMAVLHKPGHDVGRNGARALASVRGRGHPANFLAADRAYSSAKAEDFQLPALALGYRPVYDYRSDQLGVKASSQGFLQIEGAWYCPSIPQSLIDATSDFRDRRIDEDTYRTRLEQRWGYQARPKAKPDAQGHLRLQCPAASTWPLARCELKPASVRKETAGRTRIPLKADVAANPPPSCTQQSVTVAPEAGAKFHQDLLYGSPEWQATYSGLRNTNEGFNGYVKDPAHEALDDPGRRRVHGVAAQSIFTALLLLAANIRKIATFRGQVAARRAATEDGRPQPRARRRKTAPIDAWRPHWRVLPAGSTTGSPLIA
jgi:hypothetical protein